MAADTVTEEAFRIAGLVGVDVTAVVSQGTRVVAQVADADSLELVGFVLPNAPITIGEGTAFLDLRVAGGSIRFWSHRVRGGGAVAQLRVDDFDRRYRFEMVKAYPVISGVSDVHAADHAEIDAGFERVLANRNLRRTHELYLTDQGVTP